MQISTKDWKNYIEKLSKLNNTAGEKMSDYVARHGFDDPKIIDYAYGLVTKYGEGSASLSAMMYDAIAEMEGKILPPAEVANTPGYGEVAKAVNGVRKHSQNPTSYGNVVNRLVKRTGADTMLKNAERDGAEFAWIPSGDTCAFCITLASRGWQHISKKALKNGHAEHIHANCDCNYTVRFDGRSSVAGYDPDEYLEIYENAEGNTPDEKINSIRAKYRAENRDKINAQKRENYAVKHKMDYRHELDLSKPIQTSTKEGKINAKPIIGSPNNIYLSDELNIKPKRIQEVENNITRFKKLLGTNNKDEPIIILVADTELGNAGGRFDAKNNTIYYKVFVDKSIEEHVNLHELIHWSDAQEYIQKGNIINSNQDVIDYMCQKGKIKLDKKGITSDNVGEISKYAETMYHKGRFDEVYTEYRTKKELENAYFN